MDKKFIGMIASLVIVYILILSWNAIIPVPAEQEEGIAADNSAAAYVGRFFNKDKVIDIKITLSEADFQDMMANPTKEEYKQADVEIDGVKVTNVGFRVKGNSSLTSVARSDSDRYSFKVDFNQYIDEQTLEGLTKLNLNNSFSDSTYMREYLSYSLLNKMGIPTPAFAYTNVYVNEKLIGLYLAVEGVEESFVARNYGNNAGTLYKPESERGKGSNLVYTDDNIASYSGIEAVTELKNGSSEALIQMIKTLNQGQDLEKVLNVEEILKYFAVNTVLVNMDSYLGQFTHNFYLYEEDGVFSIIPWDYNMSFGGFGGGQGNGEGQTSLSIDQPVSGTTLEQRPLLGKLLEVEEYKNLYHSYIEEFINGPFTLEKMTAEIKRVADMIRPYLEKDPTKFYTMEQFEQAISDGSGQEQEQEQAQDQTQDQTQDQNQTQDTGEPAWQGESQRPQYGNQEPQDGTQMPQGGAMNRMGGSSAGLVKFISDRIANVTKQLNGELPTEETGTSSSANNNPGKRIQDNPFGGEGQGERQRGERPQRGQGNNQMPPGGMMQPDGMNRGQEHFPGEMENDSQELMVLGGSILVLLIAITIVFKLKTKHKL